MWYSKLSVNCTLLKLILNLQRPVFNPLITRFKPDPYITLLKTGWIRAENGVRPFNTPTPEMDVQNVLKGLTTKEIG